MSLVFTPQRDFYLRTLVGKRGASGLSGLALQDVTAGGPGAGSSPGGGQGGGATSIIMSQDGVFWRLVAVVGGGGGAGSENDVESFGRGGGGFKP